eukprot:TRINITY_DN29694_c0_g1_i1.p1 TRINITY_DN29694_c0_g1~~TRINITY_DN29694_c0_g1_i1.p1  ORF type:complete len:105 (+),score=5.52 TRINITY_DN29694_c0_g1_i1:718-1032(+)
MKGSKIEWPKDQATPPMKWLRALKLSALPQQCMAIYRRKKAYKLNVDEQVGQVLRDSAPPFIARGDRYASQRSYFAKKLAARTRQNHTLPRFCTPWASRDEELR